MIRLPRRPAYTSRFTPIAANLRCLAIAALCLFALGCQTAAVHQRIHGLEGAENFRDFGGYATQDGKQVKWGVLYRSNDLSRLTAADVEHVNALGVATIMDFRSSEEQQEAPTRWLGPTPNTQRLPITVMPAGSAGPGRRSGGQAPSAEQLNEMITNVYRIIPVEAAGQYRTMMLSLADTQQLPAIIHCTAGKDRTGIGAALVLSLLGVPRSTIIEDYLLTNDYPLAIFERLPPSMRVLGEVRKEWLDATFETIESRYGSVDNYFSGPLNLDAGTLARIRRNLLESRE